jgi:prepilin-type N-terminal cleavage/methylation domain-containing protein
MNLIKDRRGFSLLEVLIAVSLLGIGIMALATLQSRGIRGNDLGNRTTQAVALAQDQVEQLINSGSGGNFPLSIPNPNPFPDPNNPIDETGSGGGIFTREWEIEDPGPVPNSQNIIVTVGWTDIVGQHNVTVNGVITADSY